MSSEGKRLHEAARAEAVAGDYQWRRAEKAEGEVERLREALREITRHGRSSAALRDIARAALHPDEEAS